MAPSTTEIRIAAVGDLLLATDPWGRQSPRDPHDVFGAIGPALADADLVIGNLECTLAGTGDLVPTQPRVIATEPLVRGMREAWIGAVSLANNHTFDAHAAGFRRLREVLGEMGVASFGAGETLAEAAAPTFVTVKGMRIALLGAADRRSGPSGFAGPGAGGAAPLDIAALCDRIHDLRHDADHVLVSVHWGEERLPVPSPEQITWAHRLVTAGASLVLGHHPHVVQGMEVYYGGAIAYSLGNFVACEVPYEDGDRITWNRTERTGAIFRATLARGEVRGASLTPTCDDGRTVQADRSAAGARVIARANRRLARGVTPGGYACARFMVRRVRPLLRKLGLGG
jgi:poly-gamma-glutamate capsule biosynthesis protein CapA/YwtB (metallophosphatase superfamily)